MLVQQICNGILASGIYALYAVGFTMIFGIMGVLNMTYADFGMVAAFAVVWAVSAGLGWPGAAVVSVLVLLLGALFLERFAMRPGRRFKGDAATEMPLIATIGAGMMLQNGAALLFGNKATAFPIQLWSFVKIGGIFMTQGLIVSLVVALVLLVALELLVEYSDFGRQVRAVAQNRDAARIMGIDADRVIVLTVAMSTLLAGVAGILVGISYGVVSPLMGIPYAIKGLVAMIVGGVGSLRGAVFGAVLIGVVEALSTTWIGSASRDVSVFLILLLTLLLRPKGIIRARGVA